ncbi:MAG TPA: PIN domain-containing protein [Xanthobacteraceae bacterium]|jgi:predicted nucleic acid-binding protein|nr:PIN domain-containing protein [Xanthobacteraceae bacterium]
MAGTVLVDAGFLIALINRRDRYHSWAESQARELIPPWKTCDAVLSEAFHLLEERRRSWLMTLLIRSAVIPAFSLVNDREAVLNLMQKYADVPMSLADACLVRMTETLADPLVLTADSHFRVYRRHSRQVVPCAMPF